jgi:hypothetical protein
VTWVAGGVRWLEGRRGRSGGRPRRRPLSGPAERALRIVFMLLAGGILIAAALLSFGALRARALDAGIIHGDLGLPLVDLTLSAHTLAGVWALTVKSVTAIGIIGLRLDPSDRRAWAALLGGLIMDLAFQTYGYTSGIAKLQAAVPPLALALAIWLFEVPGRGASTSAAGEVDHDGDAGQPLPATGRPVPGSTSPPPGAAVDRPGVTVPGGAEVDRNIAHRNGGRPAERATIRSQPDRPEGGGLAGIPLAQLLPGPGDLQALARRRNSRPDFDRIAGKRGIRPEVAAEVWRRWDAEPEPETEPAASSAA